MNYTKVRSQPEMAYNTYKDLGRKASSKLLSDKMFNIGLNQKNNEYQRGLALII